VIHSSERVPSISESSDPDKATIAEFARFLSSEKDDERAKVLAAVYARLGQEMTREETLPDRVRIMTMHGSKVSRRGSCSSPG
jgi:hypothetical protein